MNVVVCIKQVPDTTAEKKLDKDHRLDRVSVENILNPFDEYAVEEALRIKENAGADVTVLCMGPAPSSHVLAPHEVPVLYRAQLPDPSH